MLLQIALGAGLIVVNLLIGAAAAVGLEIGLQRAHRWLMSEPQRLRLIAAMLAAALSALVVTSIGIWVWAVTFHLIGAFRSLEEATYFAMVSYTTLGFGDVLLPVPWRLLAGMAAANGLLMFGLQTAVLVETLRHVRLRQVEHRRS